MQYIKLKKKISCLCNKENPNYNYIYMNEYILPLSKELSIKFLILWYNKYNLYFYNKCSNCKKDLWIETNISDIDRKILTTLNNRLKQNSTKKFPIPGRKTINNTDYLTLPYVITICNSFKKMNSF